MKQLVMEMLVVIVVTPIFAQAAMSDPARWGSTARQQGCAAINTVANAAIEHVFENPGTVSSSWSLGAFSMSPGSDLTYQALVVSVPNVVPGVVLGAGIIRLSADNLLATSYDAGTELISEGQLFSVSQTKYALSAGLPIGSALDLGLRLSYLDNQLGEGAHGGGFGLEVGFQLDLSSILQFGGIIRPRVQPMRWSTGETESMTQHLSLGLSYRPSAQLVLMGQVDSETGRFASHALGAEWHVMPALQVRGGFRTNARSDLADSKASLGTTIQMGALCVDYAYTSAPGEFDQSVHAVGLRLE